jgi:hypothetical protein
MTPAMIGLYSPRGVTSEVMLSRVKDAITIGREGAYLMVKILSPEHRRRCRIDRLVSWAGRIKRDAMRRPSGKEFAAILRRAGKFGRASMDFQNSDYGDGLGSVPTPFEMSAPPKEAANTRRGIIALVFWLDRVHVERLLMRRGQL